MNSSTLSHLFDFKGRVVLVTGGSQGIGRGIALRFAQAGANVVVHYRHNVLGAEEIVSAICALGGQSLAVQADLSKPDQIKVLIERVRDVFGGLHILVNNAGDYRSSYLIEMDLQEWDELFENNLRSAHLCTQAVARLMINQQIQGVILNIASIEGIFPAEKHSHYSAFKAALIMYTRVSAKELARYQIRVNAISPGLIWRPGIEQDWSEGVRAWEQNVPLSRLGMPEDVANACLFLASPAAEWITGINLIVDGGASTRSAF